MADQNTLTGLIPTLYSAIDTVRRELTGFIPAVSRDSRAERAAKGEDVDVPVTTPENAKDITPSNVPPDSGGTTVNTRTMTITKSRAVEIQFTGEEIRGLRNQDIAGAEDGYAEIRQNRVVQAMRTLVNEVEADCAAEYVRAARAVKAAGTTPFGTTDDLDDFAAVAEVLDEYGAPEMDRQLVVGSAAMRNLRGKQTGILQKVNEAGTEEALRMGRFDPVHGLAIRNSAQVKSHTAGAGSGYQTNGGAIAADDTSIPIDTGTGTIKEGDLITFSGDDPKYINQSAQTGAGNLTIQEPGLVNALGDNVAMTDPKDYVANLGFHRSAIQLATRLPAIPEEDGDLAVDRTQVTDPKTGLSFGLAKYAGYHQVHYELEMAWGVDVTKEEWLAILLG